MGKAHNKKKEKGQFRLRAPRGSPIKQKDNDQYKGNVHNVDSFKVVSSNVDTLTSDKLQDLRVRIDLMDSKPSIIALCEVKPKNFRYERNLAEYNVEGYNLLPLNIGKDDPVSGMLICILS